MKKIVFALILTALVLGFPQMARADYEDGARIPASVVAPLMRWVEIQTGIQVPALPQVVASKSQMSQVTGQMGRLAGRVRAMYTGGQVLLDSRTFDVEDETEVSFLVHELVHYAQSFRRAGTSSWGCAQSKEVEAYTLQNKWLEEKDHSPVVSASWIRRMSACSASRSAMASAD